MKNYVIALLVAVILILAGLSLYKNSLTNKEKDMAQSEKSLTDDIPPIATTNDIKHATKDTGADTVSTTVNQPSLPFLNAKSVTDTESISFALGGRMDEGIYTGDNIIRAQGIYTDGCMKGSCGDAWYFRIVQHGRTIIMTPEINKGHPQLKEFFGNYGYTVKVDSDLTLPAIYQTPQTITAQPGITLNLIGEELGNNRIEFTLAFTHPQLGKFYTVGGADGKFYVFRPDGTFLTYVYIPNFKLTDITWKEAFVNAKIGLTGNSYVAGINKNVCAGPQNDYTGVLSPDFVVQNATIGGYLPSGDPIYVFNNNIPLIKDFYNDYTTKSNTNYSIQKTNGAGYNPDKDYIVNPSTKTFEAFMSSAPIIAWKDPFGRYFAFERSEYVIPGMCEPIVYLYPEQKEKVTVSVGGVSIVNSIPVYNQGWNVTAEPSGKITDESGKSYPYLFWDARSPFISHEERGFVVASAEVKGFLNEKLIALGLNEKEKDDFVKAWVPYFSGSPYYFITFIDPAVINAAAPLTITPKPNSLIRVLMSFEPLDKPKVVEPLPIWKPVARNGFTVVEWGSLLK